MTAVDEPNKQYTWQPAFFFTFLLVPNDFMAAPKAWEQKKTHSTKNIEFVIMLNLPQQFKTINQLCLFHVAIRFIKLDETCAFPSLPPVII